MNLLHLKWRQISIEVVKMDNVWILTRYFFYPKYHLNTDIDRRRRRHLQWRNRQPPQIYRYCSIELILSTLVSLVLELCLVMSREPELMGGGEVAEDLKEWEDVESPSKSEWDLGFPHNDGSGSLQVASGAPETPISPPPPLSTSSSSTEGGGDSDLEPESESRLASLANTRFRVADGIRRFLRLRLDAGKEKIWSRIKNFWLILPVSGMLTAALLLLFWTKVLQQWRRRRVQQEKAESFISLIKEKDEKINKLLIQIGHMNEMLSDRCRVPVIRRK